LAEQRERQQLATMLHDLMQQLLVAAKLRTELLAQAQGKNVPQLANEVRELIRECIQVSRTLTGELSPPILREGGLVPALEWLARWMKDKHNLETVLVVRGPISMQREDLTVLLFQCVRELLFNVVKHSGVNSAQIEVNEDGKELRIIVSDQGIGFEMPPDPPPVSADATSGYGLFTTQERLHLLGGTVHVDSSPGCGSRFTLATPLYPTTA